jgi:hypothetical protein
MENEMGYIVARGPEDLEHTLGELLEKSKFDSILKSKAHFILYELGNQKSMIKMDLSEWPVVFWHYDLLGRPATTTVKDVISRFAWEKCGEKEWYFKERANAGLPFSEESAATEEAAFLDWREQIFEAKNG